MIMQMAVLPASASFMPHGFCLLWTPALLWTHVTSDALIGTAYVGIAVILWVLVTRIRLPLSPVFIAFGLFIGLCGGTHFMEIWTIWSADYGLEALLKGATAAASVATAIGLLYVRPQVEELVHTARLSEQRRERLESTHAELQLLYDRVKELDELKSRFFANVSHELRTPLTLMLAPAERLLHDERLDEAQRRQVQTIERSGRMLLRQVNDLLDVARLDAGRVQPHYVTLDVAACMRLLAAQFEGVAAQRGLRFEVQLPAQLTAEVDRSMLERIAINLLSNAFKFTPDGGAVSLVLGNDDEQLHLSVLDSGPGVRPEQRELIFERFSQADGSVARKHGGTGLGLAIVRDFVQLLGGRVSVGEAASGGARFDVTLPRNAPAGVAVESDADQQATAPTESATQGALAELAPQSRHPDRRYEAPEGASATVLVVEDNAEMRRFVAETLAQRYHVVTAEDGRAALLQVQTLQPDLIVTDVMMPRVSGEQLVQSLRADPARAGIPILLLSAQADAALRVKLLESGANDFLTKPFSPTELLARAGNLVSAWCAANLLRVEPARADIPILLLSAHADAALRVKLLESGAHDFLTKPFSPAELLARAGNLVSTWRAANLLRDELASLSTDLESLAQEVTSKNRQLQLARDAAEVAREQAESASNTKTYFLGLISHEMRTPLSVIALNLQLLMREPRGSMPSSAVARLMRASNAARQLLAVIDGLLQYARVESGKLGVTIGPVDVAAVVNDVVSAHAGQAPAGVVVQSVLPPQGLPPLSTDPRLLRVLLDNLMSNALKFTTAGRIELRVHSAGDEHVFEVRDTGIGIPEDALQRIFMPFEQLEPLRRKSTPGVGLGLALVHEIAILLGGAVTVTSQVGSGSSFCLRLPRHALAAAAEPALERPS